MATFSYTWTAEAAVTMYAAAAHGGGGVKQNWQRKSSYDVAVVFAIIVQGDQPTYKAAVLSCGSGHAAAAVASAFTTISGYDGRMQAGRSPAAKKQRYITSNDRYKSRAFSLSSTCVPVPKIRHYQGNFALLYCSLTAFIPTAATGRQCDMARARRCSVGLRQQWQRWILAGRIFWNSLQVMTL